MSSGHAADMLPMSHCDCVRCAPMWPHRVSRRDFLARSTQLTLAVAATTMLASGSVRAQTTLAPDAALARLMDGNARFVAGRLTSFEEDLADLRQNNVAKQEPFAAVLSCADSRVPVEIV